MAHRRFLASLLFLGLVVSNVYGENNATLCKDIVNATAVRNASHSDFNLTVSPEKLSSHTDYKVQLDGVGNFTVLLQAVNASAPVGNWSAEKDSCDGRPLFVDYSLSNKHILTTWTSPENVTSVTIEVYLRNNTDTFVLRKILSKDSTPASNTTEAPSTANHTETVKTTHSATTHHVSKTTSAASMEKSSLVSLALSAILAVLLIPNKYLS
ncbi:uncharacterized protein ACNLHF_002644 [Anomaloglossus baeobatrachus]|uniref:uncharacterized protein LOC142257058 n=1 Tax=Anomaloglossus baeobatrachus TaxID=238106 RepID=UPI003F50CFF9